MNTLAFLALLLPAFGSAVTFIGGRDLRHVKFWSTAPIAAAFVLTLLVAIDHGSGGRPCAPGRSAPPAPSTSRSARG